MLSYLKDKMKMEEVMVLSNCEGGDITFEEKLDGEMIVKRLHKLYYSRRERKKEAEHTNTF